ncbi:MAG: peptidylprolyl isomerase A [Phycisphaerae bacterium]|nr:peptidylprolyl isomerase A [Phycisphaerae bacterium]
MNGIQRFLALSVAVFTAFAASPALAAQYAIIKTTAGSMVVELDNDKAPISVANFEAYATDGFYANTVFHRVMPGFMIQGGGFDHHGNYPAGLHNKSAHQDMRPPIANEWRNGLKNMRGTLAMARLGNQPDSATAQFFINLKDNGFLDQARDGAGYAVFGKVIAGMDVVDRIAQVPTRTINNMQNVPTTEVKINSVEIVSQEAAMKFAGAAKLDAAKQRLADAEAKLSNAQAELEAARKALEAAKAEDSK